MLSEKGREGACDSSGLGGGGFFSLQVLIRFVEVKWQHGQH
jgi:hypothetical protein